ncbi:MAG: undecaprenyl diphosphate synthase [Clostridiales bacterium]|jgi:undecaprenyl diphosphate synthase|nr:polyprenyl diphosphate synthase [Pygmaiobacter sp.]MDK2813382.1 undecaprenyl diphosphate synthase [Clostridiales bacterium]
MAQANSSAQGLHIGFIMDGNGRWAKKRGLPRNMGHSKGAQVFQDMVKYCKQLGVQAVTFYAFSTENWKRPQDEVDAIMKLLKEYLLRAFDYKKEDNRIIVLGDRSPLTPEIQQLIFEIEDGTKQNTGMTINVGINYGGREEMTHAARALAQQVADGKLLPEQINEDLLAGQLYTAGQKDPDFILRPSGEKRLSNFMLWQSAYAEFIYMDVLWPDFTRKDLDWAIAEFNSRSRRYGGL